MHSSLHICYICGGFSKNSHNSSSPVGSCKTLPFLIKKLNLCLLPLNLSDIRGCCLDQWMVEGTLMTSEAERANQVESWLDVLSWEAALRTSTLWGSPGHMKMQHTGSHHWQPIANTKYKTHNWMGLQKPPATEPPSTPQLGIPVEASDILEQRQLPFLPST